MLDIQRLLTTCLAAASLATAALADSTPDDYRRIDTLAHWIDTHTYSPAVRAKWLADTPFFWYQNRERGASPFYLVDARSGNKQRAETLEELKKLEPEAWAKAEKKQPDAPQWRGDNVVSPDGKWVAFIRDNNVCVAPAEDSKKPVAQRRTTALTTDGTRGDFYEKRLAWSPNSRFLITLRTRSVEHRSIPLIDSRPDDQVQPKVRYITYDKPGDVLPISQPVLINVAKKQTVKLATEEFLDQYALFLTGWRADSRAFTFEFNRRGHARYAVLSADTLGRITPLADERSKTFVSYINNFRHDLDDGKEMIWMSERDGYRHLYLMDEQGNVKQQLTRGEWVVRKVTHVDEKEGRIYFMASGRVKGEDPYNMHLCSVSLKGRDLRDHTPENGNHVITFSPDRRFFIDVCSRPDLPPVSYLRETAGKEPVCVLERCDVSDLLAAGWVMPEVFHAKGRDGKTEIWGTIHRPFRFDRNRRYPVVESIYAGPHDSHVNKNFSATAWSMANVAELGTIVVTIDGMGTNNRSKAFHDVCWKNLRDAGFPDRIPWIKAAARKYPQIDTTRVGIYGWSAGGQNALSALLFHGDFYKAAVSFCGCHDNRMDKVWWNELWMGYPVDESYSRSSNVDNAHLLQGDLLIINGELDDNVDPASSLQVVDALVKANKMFEQIYLPGKGHGLGGYYEMHRLYDFFERKLMGKKK